MTRGWKQRPLGRCIMAALPPFNFLSLHYAYFIITPLICSVIFWGSSSPSHSVPYVDSLFLCVSAMTGAGLNTVNLSTLNGFQQSILFTLLILGHSIPISITVLLVRRRAFQHKFKTLVYEGVQNGSSRHDKSTLSFPVVEEMTVNFGNQPVGNSYAGQDDKVSVIAETPTRAASSSNLTDDDNIQWVEDDQVTIGNMRARRQHYNPHPVFPMAGIGARPDLNNHPKDVPPNFPLSKEDDISPMKSLFKGTQKYFISKGFISRNSQFYGLSPKDREKLGGVEYRAISFLSVIILLYWTLFVIGGILGMGGWLQANHPEIPRANGLSPYWTGTFFAVSAFVNSGMSLLDANMTAFQTNVYPLITMGVLILAGNTLFPCFLRFIIWVLKCLIPNRPQWETWKVTLNFILDHPRRVYTNLFPARHTWYLLATIIILNAIDWASFEILSIGNEDIDSLLPDYRVLDGLFQAIAVRCGGFYVVNISNLRQGLLVLYVLMMYVSALPISVTMRNTNVYEERSLGIYASDDPTKGRSPSIFMSLIRQHLLGRHDVWSHETSRSYFIHQQLRSQLSHDIWWIVLAILFITIAESHHFHEDPVAYSTFNIIFEVISAYGCVGISVGFPGQNYSFCGAWYPISKLILAAVTLRGRHRGLPVAIDQAVMLPSESLAWAEEEDAALRRERTRTWGSEKMPVGSV